MCNSKACGKVILSGKITSNISASWHPTTMQGISRRGSYTRSRWRRNGEAHRKVKDASRPKRVVVEPQVISDHQRPYRVAYDVIKKQIVANQLPCGLVLLESRIAELLTMSRAPVRRALQLLHDDGLIRRFHGRGYLVGPADQSIDRIAPLRVDPLDVGFRSPEGLSESIGLFTWERIYRQIAGAIGRSIPFGTYRIIESAIANDFNVSRTVVREVLGRLRDRGLIEKNRWSMWIAGPLTAASVDECFEIRILLEPHALRTTLGIRDIAGAQHLRDRCLAAVSAESLPRDTRCDLEQEIDSFLLSSSSNRRLLSIRQECQMPMVINELFEEYFGTTDHRLVLNEKLLILEHLCRGSVEAAAAAFSAHLEATRQRTKARLKVLAVLPDPETEPYLERIH